jgi:hypothetical protein
MVSTINKQENEAEIYLQQSCCCNNLELNSDMVKPSTANNPSIVIEQWLSLN